MWPWFRGSCCGELSRHARRTRRLFGLRSFSITGLSSTTLSQTNSEAERSNDLSLGKALLQRDDASVKVKVAFFSWEKNHYSHVGRECWKLSAGAVSVLLLGQQPVCKSWQVFLQMSQLVPLRLNQANGLEFTFLFFFFLSKIIF